jgi:hypothetical protein
MLSELGRLNPALVYGNSTVKKYNKNVCLLTQSGSRADDFCSFCLLPDSKAVGAGLHRKTYLNCPIRPFNC